MFFVLQILTKFDFVPQNFSDNRNSDQGQNQDFTLNFNNRTAFSILKNKPPNFVSVHKLV